MSPLSRVYKSGSIIYFAGDKAETVYVLQKGIVTLNYLSPETHTEVRENIKSGEFFGVKSALGRFPREETVQVTQEAVVMVLSTREFEALAIKNHKLVMKMLKVFSNQLRRIGKSIQNMMDQGEENKAENGLFQIGEYYLKNKKYSQALYAYQKYLDYYPTGDFISECRTRIEMAKSGAKTGYAIASDGTSFAETTEKVSPVATESIQEEPAVPTNMDGTSIDAAKQYYEGVSFYSQGKYEQALDIFNKIVENANDPMDKFIEKSRYDIGRCLMNINRFDEAIEQLTSFIKAFPKSENLKEVLFLIGKSYSNLSDFEKAKGFYLKVIGMPPNESINKRAQKALDELGGR